MARHATACALALALMALCAGTAAAQHGSWSYVPPTNTCPQQFSTSVTGWRGSQWNAWEFGGESQLKAQQPPVADPLPLARPAGHRPDALTGPSPAPAPSPL